MTIRKPTEERRREIADAALKIIGERGLREFTTAQIAEEVGIKDGTLFRHFKDKGAITLAALDRLEQLLEPEPHSTEDPLERLGEFVRSRLRSVAVQPGLQSLLFSDQISQAMGADGPRRIAALRNRSRKYIRTCLAEALDQGRLREELDLDCASLLVSGMVMSFLFATKDGALAAPVDEMEKRCWQSLLSLIARKQVIPCSHR